MLQTTFFYTNRQTTERSVNSGLMITKYEVIKVPVFNNCIDKAERKARTIADKLGTTLAGGYFTNNAIPCNIDTDYTVINCPANTKIQPYNKKDLFIMALIEQESNMQFELI